MDWKALGQQALKIGLPILGTALLGPAGGAVGSLIAGAVGLPADASPDQLAAAIASPDNLLKLQTLQTQHNEFLVSAAATTYQAMLKAESDDQASARNLAEIDISHGNAFTSALSAIVRPLWGITCLVLFIWSLVEGHQLDASSLSIMQTILQFYFGGKIVEAVTPHLAEALATFGRK